MKTSHDIVRIKTAPVVKGLSGLRNIRGILCFGSYAVGTNDDRSDIDLYAFCQPHVPPSDARMSCIEQIEGMTGLQIDHAEFGWDNQWCPKGDRFRLNGILIDLTYNTVEWVTTVVSKVTQEGLTSVPELRFRAHTMLGLLEDSLILYDPDSVLAELRAHLRPYPPKLKQTLLSESLPVVEGSLQDLQDYLERDIGNTAFHFHLGRIQDALGTMLFAINERYDPATKRVEDAYRRLAILPDRFVERYGRILETPLTLAGRRQVLTALQALMNDVRYLLKQQTEQVDDTDTASRRGISIVVGAEMNENEKHQQA